MAKNNGNVPQRQTTAKTVMPEDLKFNKVSEDDILFWNFKQNKTITCQIVGIEKLEHDVYKVRELTSNNFYYIPMHSKIKESVDENGLDGYYKIVLNATVPFDGGRKTYNSYDVFFAEA